MFCILPEQKVAAVYLSGIVGVLCFDLFISSFSLTDDNIHHGTLQVQFGAFALVCVSCFINISKKMLLASSIIFGTGMFLIQLFAQSSDDPFDNAARVFLAFVLGGNIAIVIALIANKQTNLKRSISNPHKLANILYPISASSIGALLGFPLIIIYFPELYEIELIGAELLFLILFSLPASFPASVVACRIAHNQRQLLSWSVLIGLATFGSVVLFAHFETRVWGQLLFLSGVAFALALSVFRLGKTHIQLPPPPPDKPPQTQSEPANL